MDSLVTIDGKSVFWHRDSGLVWGVRASQRLSMSRGVRLAAKFQLCQDLYLATMDDIAQTYDVHLEQYAVEIKALSQSVPKKQRDHEWIKKRRVLQERLKGIFRERERGETSAQYDLRKSALALRHEYSDLEDMMLWADFAEEAMQKAVAREELLEARREQEERASSQAPGAVSAAGAFDRYARWFADASGRHWLEGPPGASSHVQPPDLPVGWEFMTDRDFAVDFYRRGGYQSAQEVDDQGWTPLHHAVQSSVFWDLGVRVCRGLIPLMSAEWLSAKTWGGKPSNWTALMMASNGSDVGMQRAELVGMLIEASAAIDERDDQGRTALMLAAGTGVVDVARVLVHAGADYMACSHDGRNCANRCIGSSGQARRFFINELQLEPNDLEDHVRPRYRKHGQVSESRHSRYQEADTMGYHASRRGVR